MRKLLVTALIMATTGCASRPEPAELAQSACSQYGYQVGTEDYRECVMTLHAMYQQEADVRARMIANGMIDMGRSLNRPLPPRMRCNTVGDSTQCLQY